MPVRHWVVASRAYLAAHAAIERPEDWMARSRLSLGEQARASHWRFSRTDEAVDVVVDGRYTFNHSEMRLAAGEAGLGVGCVPDFVAPEAQAAGRVVRLLPDWAFDTNCQREAYLLFSATAYTAPKMRALIGHLVTGLDPAIPAAGRRRDAFIPGGRA